MRVLIASDIHGSEFFMKKLMERYAKENVDQLILLGDLYYHGPRNPLPEGYNSQKVADILNNISDKILCVRGNCDSEVDEMISKFHFTENLQLYINNKKEVLFIFLNLPFMYRSTQLSSSLSESIKENIFVFACVLVIFSSFCKFIISKEYDLEAGK